MRILLLFLFLSACASSAPEFAGARRHDVTLEGIHFAVFHKDNRAEVIRLGYLTREQRRPVPLLMIRAVEQTTGCRVLRDSFRTRLPGETGEARMSLHCGWT
ncbi:hypothetical protein [Paracoccus aminophilus]|uniref:Lipoprotein n=1 Tax=Paracoccus aminophilus JCM 7686 TaxID=1367847 RepID=S5XQZ8_PARAH|nr:hypothetical protein [Paracoccus aminophilus]AGT09829.1 hypothetical protein JCM7686_2773 [Paracoccus aminophilus JCM 7686]